MTDEMRKVPDNETANVNGGAVAAPAQVPDFPEHPYKVDPAKCVCCGTCVALCPVKAIAMTELSAVIRGHCIECGTCDSACPANAIFKNTSETEGCCDKRNRSTAAHAYRQENLFLF